MKNANTISEAQSYLDRKTQNSFDLSQELAEFWSMLKNKILETSDEAQVPEPLIYVYVLMTWIWYRIAYGNCCQLL